MQPSYQKEWPALYQAIRQSPVKISEIDWRKPDNLILTTEIGRVHIGSYGSDLPQKLIALDQLRNLNNSIAQEKIAFIDLSNPKNPTIEILQANHTP
jgi:cell division protein FtsQ